MIVRILEGETSKYDHWYHKYAGMCLEVVPANMGFYPVGDGSRHFITNWHTYPVAKDEEYEVVKELDFSVEVRPSVEDAIREFEKNIRSAHQAFRDDVNQVLVANTITIHREGAIDINLNSRR